MRRFSSSAGGDPLSASQKIAEMGLSRGASEAVAPIEQPESKQRDFGAIMNESAAAVQEDDDDSDDLF